MDIAELLTFVYSGPNAVAFGLLNVVAFAAHRLAIIDAQRAFMLVTLIGAMVGGLGSFIEAQAIVGVNPVILSRAALLGIILGAGSATLIGLTLSKALEAAGYPLSESKKEAEAIRDPMNPTSPPADQAK